MIQVCNKSWFRESKLAESEICQFSICFEQQVNREEVEQAWRDSCEEVNPLDDGKIKYVMRGTNQSRIQNNIAENFGISPRYALDFKPK